MCRENAVKVPNIGVRPRKEKINISKEFIKQHGEESELRVAAVRIYSNPLN